MENIDEVLKSSTYAEISRSNARYLASNLGGFAKFAERVGLSDSQVSQFLGKNPTRNIGVKTARRIEEAFGMPLGWLDQLHDVEMHVSDSDANIESTLHAEINILKDQIAKATACLRAYESAGKIDQGHLVGLAIRILDGD